SFIRSVSTLLPMDRISSCAMSSSLENDDFALNPQRSRQSAGHRGFLLFFSGGLKSQEKNTVNGGTITFILSFIKITTLPHSSQNYNKISADDKQGRTSLSSSQFILSGFVVVWR